MTDLATEQLLWVRRLFKNTYIQIRKQGLPWYSASKESACSAGDPDWVQLLDWVDPLQKEMATHSSILVCKILGTDELCGL